MAQQKPEATREAIHVEYVHGTATVAELAQKHGIKLSTITGWAATDMWAQQRKEAQKALMIEANKRAFEKRLKELQDWNSGDMILAKAIRNQVADILKRAQTAKENNPNSKDAIIHPDHLNTLARVIEATQRIVRTALGVGEAATIEPTDAESEGVTSVKVIIKDGRIRKNIGDESAEDES